MLTRIGSQNAPDDISNSTKSSQSIDEKINKMKKAEVIDAEFEVVKEKDHGNKPR